MRWSGQGYINHPDHRAAGEATLAAIMPVASTRLAFPELAAEGLTTHNVKEIYISGTQNADRWVDIGGYVEKKVEALRQHVSQLGGWDPQEGMTQWAKEGGDAARKHGHDFTYAEASNTSAWKRTRRHASRLIVFSGQRRGWLAFRMGGRHPRPLDSLRHADVARMQIVIVANQPPTLCLRRADEQPAFPLRDRRVVGVELAYRRRDGSHA